MKTPISSTASENGLIVLIQPVLFVKQGANLAYHSPETIEPKILQFFCKSLIKYLNGTYLLCNSILDTQQQPVFLKVQITVQKP